MLVCFKSILWSSLFNIIIFIIVQLIKTICMIVILISSPYMAVTTPLRLINSLFLAGDFFFPAGWMLALSRFSSSISSWAWIDVLMDYLLYFFLLQFSSRSEEKIHFYCSVYYLYLKCLLRSLEFLLNSMPESYWFVIDSWLFDPFW